MRRITLLLPILLLACGDKGSDGDAGAGGTDGATGEDGTGGTDGTDGTDGADGSDADDGVGLDFQMTGTATDGTDPIAAAPTMLYLVDGDGHEVAAIGTTFTAEDGTFQISLADFSAPSTQMLAVVYGAGGDLMSLGTSTTMSVTPASTAVTEIIGWIVDTEEGRYLWDFDTADIDTLVTDADTALVAAGTDLTDQEAVTWQVLTDVGGAIADASGGTYSAGEAIVPFSTEGAGVESADSGYAVYLYDGLGFDWDIYTYYGYINDGGSDAYDAHGRLYVDGSSFYTGTSSYVVEDDYELVLGPDTLSDLDVSRKVYVSPTDGFSRHIEIFENNTSADITVDIHIYGDMGPGSTTIADYTSSGDDVLDSADSWVVSGNDSDGSTSREVIGWVFPGADAQIENGDQIFAYWSDVTVPAGDRVTIVHWNFQRDADGEADLAAEIMADFTTSGVPTAATYFTDMAFDEFLDNEKALIEENLIGEAGAVAPFATVTVENTTQSITIEGDANSDGSFAIGILADSGDSLTITATDGTSDTVSIP